MGINQIILQDLDLVSLQLVFLFLLYLLPAKTIGTLFSSFTFNICSHYLISKTNLGGGGVPPSVSAVPFKC